MLRPDDMQKACLFLTAWREGNAYGGTLATEAIMSTIMNRVKAGWGSCLEVIEDLPNKSATTLRTGMPKLWEPQASRLLHSVEGIFDGSAKDLSNGALYWFDSNCEVTNEWFKDKILGDLNTHKKTADMNSLMFLR